MTIDEVQGREQDAVRLFSPCLLRTRGRSSLQTRTMDSKPCVDDSKRGSLSNTRIGHSVFWGHQSSGLVPVAGATSCSYDIDNRYLYSKCNALMFIDSFHRHSNLLGGLAECRRGPISPRTQLDGQRNEDFFQCTRTFIRRHLRPSTTSANCSPSPRAQSDPRCLAARIHTACAVPLHPPHQDRTSHPRPPTSPHSAPC